MTENDTTEYEMDPRTPPYDKPAEESSPGKENGETEETTTGEPGNRQENRDENTRTKLKEVTGERDALSLTVTEYRTAEVESIASEWLSYPPDLWIDVDLDSLTSGGKIDSEKVKSAVDECVRKRPNTSKVGHYHKEPDGSWTFMGGSRPTYTGGYGQKSPGNPGWSDILASRNR